MMLRVGSLFAGFGGLDLAVSSVLDAEMAWCSEFDKAPSKILAHRFPDAPNLGDVTKVDWSQVEPVDIITGGSPCQDLSHAGKRAGMKDGTRSGLWSSMLEAIDTIRPSLVVWENVRGALSAEADSSLEPCAGCVGDGDDGPVLRALGRVLGDLANIGYDAAWTGLRAADVGAPHGRWRVFVLAWPADTAGNSGRECDGDSGFTADAERSEGRVGHDAHEVGGWSRQTEQIRVGDRGDVTLLRTPTAQLAVNGGSQHPDKRRAGGHGPTLADEVEHLLPTPAVNDMGAAYTPDQWDAQLSGEPGSPVRNLPPENPLEGGPRGATGSDRCGCGAYGAYARAIHRWEGILGRPAPPPTEPTGREGAPRLSARLTEWMMGLPDGWVTDPGIGITRNEQLKALGNGVVPQQCAAALRYLLNIREEVLAA